MNHQMIKTPLIFEPSRKAKNGRDSSNGSIRLTRQFPSTLLAIVMVQLAVGFLSMAFANIARGQQLWECNSICGAGFGQAAVESCQAPCSALGSPLIYKLGSSGCSWAGTGAGYPIDCFMTRVMPPGADPTQPLGWIQENVDHAYTYIPDLFVLQAPSNICLRQSEGDPCDLSSGAEIYSETDYRAPGRGLLTYTRNYNSLQGAIWTDRFNAHMTAVANSNPPPSPNVQTSNTYFTASNACVSGWNDIKNSVWGGTLSGATATYLGADRCQISSGGKVAAIFLVNMQNNLGQIMAGPASNLQTVTLPNGATYTFQLVNGNWVEVFHQNVALRDTGTGFAFSSPDNTILTFNYAGALTGIRDIDGQGVTQSRNLPRSSGGDLPPLAVPLGRQEVLVQG